ncbi:MAG: DUF262 domain-containing protein, partial [Candidatus Xenobia bacterium]
MFPTGEKCALLPLSAGRQLLFTLITVSDELSAYTVFETLNARGVSLSTTDLLKNHLFSQLLAETDVQALERHWQSLIDTVQQQRFPEFLRYHLMVRQDVLRKEELFALVRTELKTSRSVFSLVGALENRSELYAALLDPGHPYWIEWPAARPWVRDLVLFRSRQAMPLLFVAWERMDAAGFVDVLRSVSILSFRYIVVCGRNPTM